MRLHSTFYTPHSTRVLRTAERGQAALITMLFFLTISSIVVFSITHAALTQARISRDLINSKRAIAAAESAVEASALSFKGGGDVVVPTITYSGGNAPAVVITQTSDESDFGTKYVFEAEVNNRIVRKTTLEHKRDIVLAYAVQAEEDIEMKNSVAIENGSVYAGGKIYKNSASGVPVVRDLFRAGESGYVIAREEINDVDISGGPSECDDSEYSLYFVASQKMISVSSVYTTRYTTDGGGNTNCAADNEKDALLAGDLGVVGPPMSEETIIEMENYFTNCQGAKTVQSGSTANISGCYASLTVKNNNTKAMMTGDVYVTGSVSIQDGAQLLTSGVGPRRLVARGKITVQNQANATGLDSTTLGCNSPIDLSCPAIHSVGNLTKLVALISLDDEDDEDAIEVKDSGRAIALLAPYGKVFLRNSASVVAVYGKNVTVQDNSTPTLARVTYHDEIRDNFHAQDYIKIGHETY